MLPQLRPVAVSGGAFRWKYTLKREDAPDQERLAYYSLSSRAPAMLILDLQTPLVFMHLRIKLVANR